MDGLFSDHQKSLSVGPVEHVHRVRLPVASIEDAAAEVARKTFHVAAQHGGKFSCFPRLPAEIQNMIWRATFEPKTFRAWIVRTGDWLDSSAGELDNRMEWLLLEYPHYRRTHIPISRVCRRSRALAEETYGVPSEDNPILFSPALDTVCVLGKDYITDFNDVFSFAFLSPEAAEDGRVQVVKLMTRDLMPESRAEHGALKPYYWAAEAYPVGSLVPELPKYWVAFTVPFERARNAVINSERLSLIYSARGANTLLPDIEELTIRPFLSGYDRDDVQAVATWKDDVENIIDLFQREGSWPRLRAINFERQSGPELVEA